MKYLQKKKTLYEEKKKIKRIYLVMKSFFCTAAASLLFTDRKSLVPLLEHWTVAVGDQNPGDSFVFVSSVKTHWYSVLKPFKQIYISEFIA